MAAAAPITDPETGRIICGGRRRSDGLPCKSDPMPGRTRCKWHGGATLRGAAGPNFKHGRHSKFLPANLKELYDSALNDEDLLSNREQVALLTARVLQLTQRLQTGETRELWVELRAAWADLMEARGGGDAEGLQTAINRIGLLIRRGGEAEDTWELLHDAINERVKASEAEQRYLQMQHQTLTLDSAMTMFAFMVESIRRHVADPLVIERINGDLSTLLIARGVNGRTTDPDEPDDAGAGTDPDPADDAEPPERPG